MLVLGIYRLDVKELLAGMTKFVNLGNTTILYDFFKPIKQFVLSEEASNERINIFKTVEAKMTFYCKIFEKLLYATYASYMAVPVIQRVLASRTGTTIVVYPDVGFFHDL